MCPGLAYPYKIGYSSAMDKHTIRTHYRPNMPKVIVTETPYGVRVECDSDRVALRECAKYEQGGYRVSLVAGMGDSYVFDVYVDR